jgi:penicillin-binding protein 2
LFLLNTLLFLFLCGRLGYIQLLKNNKLAGEAVRQRAQTILLNYNRGDILDRHGISLLGGEEEKLLVVFPDLLKKDNMEVTEIVSRYFPQAVATGSPFIALRGIDAQEEKTFKDLQTPGLLIAPSRKRYGHQALATHVTGHIGPHDGEGKVGLELTFNGALKSAPTVLAAVVDNKNNLVEGLGYRLWENREPHKPFDLVLTIDYQIQKKIEEVMDARMVKGAVVVMAPPTGDIFAMASRPNYLQAELSHYLNDVEQQGDFLGSQPFINRSILSYPPGSVFKIVVAAAALDSGKARLNRKFYCPGYIQVGEQIFHCQHGPHGVLTLAEAFAHSCNAAFIELALDLGKETICQYADALGLGRETGIPLGSADQGGEVKGCIPRPEEMPFLGDLALAAIGQGQVEATPLQVARLTAALANGGYLVEPRLVKAIQSRQGTVFTKFSPAAPRKVLKELTVNKLRYMMLGVVEYGTGKAAGGSTLILGGKTGTAETKRYVNGKPQVYSWFTGCVPLENCQAVVTVFIEEPLQGSAAETFKEIAQVIVAFLH